MVEGVPLNTAEKQINQFFKRYAGFKNLRLPKHRPGIAIVEYATEDDALPVLNEMHGFNLNNSVLRISLYG